MSIRKYPIKKVYIFDITYEDYVNSLHDAYRIALHVLAHQMKHHNFNDDEESTSTKIYLPILDFEMVYDHTYKEGYIDLVFDNYLVISKDGNRIRNTIKYRQGVDIPSENHIVLDRIDPYSYIFDVLPDLLNRFHDRVGNDKNSTIYKYANDVIIRNTSIMIMKLSSIVKYDETNTKSDLGKFADLLLMREMWGHNLISMLYGIVEYKQSNIISRELSYIRDYKIK